MKIAIPSNDRKTILGHFGRTKGFMIYDIEGDKIISKEYRSNNFTGHAKGHHEHSNEHHHAHSHAGIFKALYDCKTVIAGGMGRRLYNDFETQNIKIFVTKEKDINTAVGLFINDVLDNSSDKCCSH